MKDVEDEMGGRGLSGLDRDRLREIAYILRMELEADVPELFGT